ncbi:hypothetical protein ACFXAF_24450 [Kitasatospora sp. NPDC059463]|uniref:hypothetical protein n=1 Tax=unclassified Kitasatospora TaxID=2633591 RepID=UPI00367D9DDB
MGVSTEVFVAGVALFVPAAVVVPGADFAVVVVAAGVLVTVTVGFAVVVWAGAVWAGVVWTGVVGAGVVGPLGVLVEGGGVVVPGVVVPGVAGVVDSVYGLVDPV